ncbi:exopolysaccharide transport family protein [Parasediminibacterium sp. JCM 36343]|uniref:exopolysaccharide transport family protein n=1 Tax=Parasediminibacterium sp. JCM 36343 TaxID=3374279 RepID=UPI003979F29A
MILASSLIAIAFTFTLTKHLPESFTSRGRLATGLVDQTEAQVLDSKQDAQESQINLQFANLIQSIQLKKILDQVSYLLILHDLKDSTPTFRKKSKLFLSLDQNQVAHYRDIFIKKYTSRESLYLYDADQKKLDDLLNSMGYDLESLKKKLSVYRVSNSDFIDLEIEGDNPYFCAFVINSICSEFVAYYGYIVKENHVKGVDFLETLLQEKRDSMNAKMQALKEYKIQNRVLNLAEQAKSIYAQIADFESRKEITEKDVLANAGAIRSIDNMFNPQDRMYVETAFIKLNQQMLATKDILKRYTEKYISSNYDPKIKVKIDSLQSIITAQILQQSDKYITDPLSAKTNLISQKLTLQVQLEVAKNSIASLQNKINSLNAAYDKLVPHEAVIQSFETEIDIASKEYIEILQKYNQTSMESTISPRIKQIEMAMPGPAAPSKKMILTAASGVVPVVLYIVVLFIVFYLDDSLKTSRELANKTNIPVLGYLPLLKKTSLNLQSVWNSNRPSTELQRYKTLLRSARFEVEMEMKDSHVLAVTSISEGEGKSFTALSLAYAYSMANKKVLLIDGDFDFPSITEITKSPFFLEDYLNGTLHLLDMVSNDGFSVLANKGGDTSLFELCEEHVVKQKINVLKDTFDVIIIDANALDNMNKSKEWVVMAEKVLAIFQANQTISSTKDLQINYLRGIDKQFIGFILNKVSNRKSRLKRLINQFKNRKKKRKNNDD